MPHLDVAQILFLDEKHWKCILGAESKWDYVRKLCDGTYGPWHDRTRAKYEKQVRFCFGGMMVEHTRDGVEDEGRRMEPFEYTSHWICGVPKFMAAAAQRIQNVSTMKSPGWKTFDASLNLPGGRYEAKYGNAPYTSDKQTVTKNGIKLEPASALWKQVGAHSLHPVTAKPLKAWEVMLFRDVAKVGSKVGGYRCVTDMMQWTVAEGDRLFADTAYAKTWVIGHDALSAWWEQGTKQEPDRPSAQGFLAKLGFKDRQLKALGDTNKGKRYANKLVGDSPELMPWDNNLFADLSNAMYHHCALTCELDKDDPKKFQMGRPSQATSCVRRIWEVSPTSARIVEDIKRWKTALMDIKRCQGAVVPEHNRLRKGRRHAAYRPTKHHADAQGAIDAREMKYEAWAKECGDSKLMEKK